VWHIHILGLARINMGDKEYVELTELVDQAKRIADTLERLLKISEMSL